MLFQKNNNLWAEFRTESWKMRVFPLMKNFFSQGKNFREITFTRPRNFPFLFLLPYIIEFRMPKLKKQIEF